MNANMNSGEELLDLVEHFKNRKFNQGQGVLYVNHDERDQSQCGCVGAVAAKHLNTRTFTDDYGREYYAYVEGVRALAKLLLDGRDYKSWLERNFVGAGHEDNLVSYGKIWLDDYLHLKCGAPKECFGMSDWPKNIEPAEVMRRAYELNFGGKPESETGPESPRTWARIVKWILSN